MIVAASDIHLGHYCSDKRQFTRFLDEVAGDEKVHHLVLAGDIFDMWRRDPLKVVLENIDVFEKLALLQESKEVHFLAGNHDYHMIELKSYMWEQFNLDVSMDVSLSCRRQNYHFLHGHQFEFPELLDTYQEFANLLCMGDDRIGSTADSLWELYKKVSSILDLPKSFFNERFRKALKTPGERLTEEDIDQIRDVAITQLRTQYEDQIGERFIVYGHTHRPFVDQQIHQANTGSWVDDPSLPMFKKNTYIVIEEYNPPLLREYP